MQLCIHYSIESPTDSKLEPVVITVISIIVHVHDYLSFAIITFTVCLLGITLTETLAMNFESIIIMCSNYTES